MMTIDPGVKLDLVVLVDVLCWDKEGKDSSSVIDIAWNVSYMSRNRNSELTNVDVNNHTMPFTDT